MPGIATVGDKTKGICDHGLPCCPHITNGVWTTGSPNVLLGGKPVVRVGDEGTHDCPHCGKIIAKTGSPTIKVNGKSVHRVGDEVDEIFGVGITITGSGTLLIDEE